MRKWSVITLHTHIHSLQQLLSNHHNFLLNLWALFRAHATKYYKNIVAKSFVINDSVFEILRKKIEQNLDSMFFNRRDKIHIKNISPETFPFTCKLPPFLKQLRKYFTLYHNVSKSSNFEHTRLYVKKTACSLIANIFIWKYEKLLVCTASGVVFWLLLDIY